LTLFPTDDETLTRGGEQSREAAQPPPHPEYLIEETPTLTSKLSKDPIRISVAEMEVEDFKRTRAKTPCFWIGALEDKAHSAEANDRSAVLADQYQCLLPLRTFTPFSEPEVSFPPRRPHRTVRKVKGSRSLRELVTCQEVEEHSSSDTETLVGTPSLGSPTSQQSFSWKGSPGTTEIEETGMPFAAADPAKDDVGFQMCLDLLTSELAAGLFKKHPSEDLDRPSGLQILLMIEAYESIQKDIRQEIKESHVTGEKFDQVKAVEKSLDYWLEALYALYDKDSSMKSMLSAMDDVRPISRLSVHSTKKLVRRESEIFQTDAEDIYYDFEDLYEI
jgi:hypothetical protein